MKYRVNLQRVDSASVAVEAADEQEAVHAAFDLKFPYLCAQCSGWGGRVTVDEGEWEPLDGEDAVEVADEEDQLTAERDR